MTLKVDLSALWSAINKMGVYESDFDPGTAQVAALDIDVDLSSRAGLDISLEDLDVNNGILSYEGRQVLLFIPDHGTRYDDVVCGNKEGNKFHVADCSKLDDMRKIKRFNRYKATYNTSGIFEIFGTSFSSGQNCIQEIELHVCKLCLGHLNYQGYKSGGVKSKIYNEFSISEFLSAYSTLFKNMPDRRDMVDEAGYSDDWSQISLHYRTSKNFTCESCHVCLTAQKNLLHTHHINGNKRQNVAPNLMALCIDCHRKQPHHEYMRVTAQDMQTINGFRRSQGLLNSLEDWPAVMKLADKALDGVLRHYQKAGFTAPEVGYLLKGTAQTVIAELDVAWPSLKKGLTINSSTQAAAKAIGWSVPTVGEAVGNPSIVSRNGALDL